MGKTISQILKLRTKAITTDPWQFAAYIDGYDGFIYLGNTSEDRSDVRRKAAEKLDRMGDDPRILKLLTK